MAGTSQAGPGRRAPQAAAVRRARGAAPPPRNGVAARGTGRATAAWEWPTPAGWSIDERALATSLGAEVALGLSAGEARRRRARHGPNAIRTEAEEGWPRLLLRQFASPLVLILLFGAGVSAVLQEWGDAAIILVILGGSAALSFVQETRAALAMKRLKRRLALKATVLRDGRPAAVPATHVVPGDVVLLRAGALVPADARVLEATDLLVIEAALTGESLPVEKRAAILPPDTPLAQRTNCVHAGTSVRSGTASVLVTATGPDTAFGAIAQSLAAQPPESAFAQGLRHFGEMLLRVMLVMVLFALVANQWLGRPVIDSLLFAVALAVGLSPELLPAVVSVTLSKGARAMARRGVIVRRLEAIENLGSIDVLCTDKTGTLTEGEAVLHEAQDAAGAASPQVRRLACVNAAFETGIENPLDAALIAAGQAAGLSLDGWRKVDEIPYDFQRRRLTVVAVPPADLGGAPVMIVKGAFEPVLALCRSVAAPDRGDRPLDGPGRLALRRRYEDHGLAGYRVLALATRSVPAEQADFTAADERDLRFEGLLLFVDPPKASAGAALRALAARGIRVKVVTGDNRHVTAHIAAALGLGAPPLLTGAELNAMSDEALVQRAPRTDLFVEVDPHQKERIVRALQRGGCTVGYLGDGINDAPSLRHADVGISVDGAVDVARDSADIVLLRPDLEVLRRGVEEGRRSFANTMKYLRITTSANFGNMVSMALGAPFLPFLPLTAKQILLNNLLSDIPSIAISTDRVDAHQVRSPQHWDLADLRRFMIVFGLLSSAFDLLTFWLLHAVLGADRATFQTAWFSVSLLTELAVVLVLRSRHPPWRSPPSNLLLGTTAAVAALALAVPFLPALHPVIGFTALAPSTMAAVLGVVVAYVACTEVVKRLMDRPPPRPRR